MQVLIMRHGPAEDRLEFAQTGLTDDHRPLSKDGVGKMQRAVKGLRTLLPELGLIASSPLKRAEQTADLLALSYPKTRRTQMPELAPGGSFTEVCAWLQKHRKLESPVVLVGHEPDLGELVSWFLAGDGGNSFMPIKKGAVVMLEFNAGVESRQAVLRWALTAGHLRKLNACAKT